MKKFIWINNKGKTSIYECEVSLIRPKPFNLKGDEEKYSIDAPANLKENLEYSFSFFFADSYQESLAKYIRAVIDSFETTKTTRGTEYTKDDVNAKLDEVKFVPLISE
jgi:hypothetical protein